MAQIPNPNDIVSETIQRAQQQQPEAIEKLVHHIERIARKSFGDFSPFNSSFKETREIYLTHDTNGVNVDVG
ncbi:hypothetical protein QS428_08760 [Staphylococcus pseudintermedius]|nr:hypothetical protein QS428_08760 [Staphylococcus pseudintermedius]